MILVGAIAVLILVTSVLWIGAWLYGTISEGNNFFCYTLLVTVIASV